MSHRNRRITIVYRHIEFVTWTSSIVTWNLSRGYRLSPHRICHVDIVYRHIVIGYCHIVIVYRRIDVVTCSSSHSATFRATVLLPPCIWSIPLMLLNSLLLTLYAQSMIYMANCIYIWLCNTCRDLLGQARV